MRVHTEYEPLSQPINKLYVLEKHIDGVIGSCNIQIVRGRSDVELQRLNLF